jgi:8-oxo-dGTP pyrophosphatase MutT (NUDIX family)
MQMSLIPKRAAAVVLIRPCPMSGSAEGPVEVYLTQRPDSMAFAAGNFVFPGGKLDPSDYALDNLALARGLEPEQAARVLGDGESPERAMGFFLAAIRELFEEAGILLCVTPRGDVPDLTSPEVQARLADGREDVHQRKRTLASLMQEFGLHYDPAALHYLTRWITPVFFPMRYDARYFLCEVPEGQVPSACRHEVTGVRWVQPGEALGRWRAGEFKMRAPTANTLIHLAQYSTCKTVMAAARSGKLSFRYLTAE